MNKKFTLIVVLILITQLGFAQQRETDANIIGDVQCNGVHVPYATILIDGTTVATSTDATGHFHITHLPPKTYTIRVRYIGYKSTSQEVTVASNKTVEVKFQVEKDELELEGVVVSADRNQTNRAEAPVVVTSISPKVLEQTQSVCLGEGLNFVPGLRTEANCQNCGFSQLRMNGLEGHYTQILMNSHPIFSGLAGVYGLEIIPSNMIERLEVVRGGGSALFGGNAIAGTVNVITKEPRRNSFSLETRYGLRGVGNSEGGDAAHDAQANFNASLVSDDAKSGGYIYAMMRDRGGYDANGDGFTENVMMKNTTFGFNIYHKPTTKTKVSLDAYRLNEFRRGGEHLDWLPHNCGITEQLKHTITGTNLTFDLFTHGYDKLTVFGAMQQVERESYYGGGEDLSAYGATADVTASFGSNYTIHSDNFLFAPSTTILGIEDNYSQLQDDKLRDVPGNNIPFTNQKVNTIGAFVQQDWKSEKLNVSLGVRFDNYMVQDLKESAKGEKAAEDITGNVFLPRASLMYKITPDIRFRVGYAQGYRAPQVFDEDMHIELIGSTQIRTVNDPDLKEEKSHAFTASLNTDFFTGDIAHNFLVEGFYTMLVDPFANDFERQVGANGERFYIRENAEKGAHVAGANIEYQTIFSSKLKTSLGLTVQESQYEEEQEIFDGISSKDYVRTPNVYGYFTIDWNVTDALDIDLGINYTGAMKVPHATAYVSEKAIADMEAEGKLDDAQEARDGNADLKEDIAAGNIIKYAKLEDSESFIVVDLLCRYNIKLSSSMNLELFAGAKNIFNSMQSKFDKGANRDAGYIYGPSQPRTINFGINIGI